MARLHCCRVEGAREAAPRWVNGSAGALARCGGAAARGWPACGVTRSGSVPVSMWAACPRAVCLRRASAREAPGRQCGTGAPRRAARRLRLRGGHATRQYGGGLTNPRTQMRDAGCGISDDAEKGETENEDGPSFYGLKGVLKKFWAKI